jgi:hypothetical protein
LLNYCAVLLHYCAGSAELLRSIVELLRSNSAILRSNRRFLRLRACRRSEGLQVFIETPLFDVLKQEAVCLCIDLRRFRSDGCLPVRVSPLTWGWERNTRLIARRFISSHLFFR